MISDALVVSKPGAPFEYKQVRLDDRLRDNEVLIRVKAVGICQTDLDFSNEKSVPELFPGILGHEGAGIVDQVGTKVTTVAPGDHVILTYSSCGSCRYCKKKETSYCDLWFKYNFGIGRLDGSTTYSDMKSGKKIASHFFGQSSFAKYVLVMDTAVVKVEKDIPFHELAPLGCGIMTGAGAMLNVIQPTADMTIAVVGAGVVGLAAIMSLRMLETPPRKIIAIDVVGSKLEMARKYGATHGVNSKYRPELMKVLMEITDGRGVDGSIDTTGEPAVIRDLIHSAARKGKIVTVGFGDLSAEVSHNMFEMVNSGCSYVGCNQGDCYPPEFLPQLVKAHISGNFPYEKMIQAYPAKDFEQAIKDVQEGSTIKAVLLWN